MKTSHISCSALQLSLTLNLCSFSSCDGVQKAENKIKETLSEVADKAEARINETLDEVADKLPLQNGEAESDQDEAERTAGTNARQTAANGDSSSDADLLQTIIPSNSRMRDYSARFISLTRTGYLSQYDPESRLPIWVAWHLTDDHITGPYKREGVKFHEDEDVPTPRATDADYRSSGYDRGHMCPSGDNKWSQAAQEESFLFTNICPQIHNLNAGDWNELENKCRVWAETYGDVYIVCGPVFLNRKHKTIGQNKVVVPEAFFKVVLRTGDEPKAIGFIYRNEKRNSPMSSYVNTIDDVERITGLDFFSALPDKVESAVEADANLLDWE